MTPEFPRQAELQALADELRAIAGFGLNFARNPHDVERYQAVLAAAARLNGILNGRSPADLLAEYEANAFQLSAAPSGEAVVMHAGKLLLVRREDDGLWALPGGLTDPGETLAESARRELWEETGICGRVTQLLGIFDSRLWHSAKQIHFYHAVFLIEPDDPTPRPTPEVAAAAYFAEDDLPPLSPGHHLRAPFVFKQLRGDEPLPYFDPVGAHCA